jgi:diguanylate cyclase (GGDEF)-like protein
VQLIPVHPGAARSAFVLACGSGGAVALGVAAALGAGGPVPVTVAALLAAGWAVAGVPELRLLALGAVVPACALLPGGGWIALAGWTAAGACGAAGVAYFRRAQLRPAAERLRAAERERQTLHRHLRRYPALMEACLQLAGARDVEHFAVALAAHAHALVPEARWVRVFVGDGRGLRLRAQADAPGEHGPDVAGADEAYVAAEHRPLARRERDGLRIAVPLAGDRGHGQGLRGVLAVALPAGFAGDHLARELLDALGRIGGLALAAVDLLSEAEALALTDHLTGLPGRLEFLRRAEEQAARGRRAGRPLALAMCDLDRLKAVNDRHGHAAGDAALHAVAQALGAALPRHALAARFGGEEFAVLLPDHDAAAALAACERLRAACAAAEVARVPGLRLTASFGVALLAGRETVPAALERADQALYRAKAAGRNRVEAAS